MSQVTHGRNGGNCDTSMRGFEVFAAMHNAFVAMGGGADRPVGRYSIQIAMTLRAPVALAY